MNQLTKQLVLLLCAMNVADTVLFMQGLRAQLLKRPTAEQ
jgi:hypothetical protein